MLKTRYDATCRPMSKQSKGIGSLSYRITLLHMIVNNMPVAAGHLVVGYIIHESSTILEDRFVLGFSDAEHCMFVRPHPSDLKYMQEPYF